MNRNVLIAFLSSLVVLDVLAASVAAQGTPPTATTPVAPAQLKSTSKLSFRLETLARSAALRTASAPDQARALHLPEKGAGSLMRDARGQILIQVRMSETSNAQQQALRAAGATITHVSTRYRTITALVDAGKLTSVADIASVQNVREVLRPKVKSENMPPTLADEKVNAPAYTCPWGNNVTEGDTQLNAAAARSTFGIDGTGVTVGILSDSYDVWTSAPTHASNDVASGDLPGSGNPCGYTAPVSVLDETSSSDVADEGRAMLQIVHDLAPSASLKFATAWDGLDSFADNIRALRTAGSDIIADDIFYFDEPFFQEGPVNVAISDVVSSGALYFTAAGNDNVNIGGNNVGSYEAPAYRPTTCPVGVPAYEESCHDFDPSGGTDNSLDFSLSNNSYVYLVFQWAQPWYGVSTDLDLYVTNNSGTLITWSEYLNPGPFGIQEPFEYVYVSNTSGSTQIYHLYLGRYTTGGYTGTPRIKTLFLAPSGALQSVSPSTSSGGDIVGPTIGGHSATVFGFSVAAVPYNNSNVPESYSSRGPATHYYGPVVDSNPAPAITPQTLQQPDFAATDGGCTTFFYGFSGGCYRFYGTSASAPHAAAVTALLKHKANQLHVPLNRGWTKVVLQSTASTVSGGDVYSVGAGLLNALSATQKLVDSSFVFLPGILR